MFGLFRSRSWQVFSILSIGILLVVPQKIVGQVPSPSDVFGFVPGANYKMADYGQLTSYYRQLSSASDRVRMKSIGTTVMRRSMKLLFISSSENLARLDRWREVSATLARARVEEARARRLSRMGKAVVWIDAGLHATERAPGQAMPALAHRLATSESQEVRKIRENTVLLLMPMMNPDGLHIVESWYDRVLDTPYETTDPPWLYHKYAGHDNNRDWFMNTMPETRAVTDVIFNEWYPQIVVNHHQTAPEWARIFIPPFTGPVNPRIHPGVVAGVNQVGAAMGQRFAMKGMPGVVSNDIYTMFWNGGMRTAPYFHNQIGILTEVAHETPSPRYYAPDSLPAHVGERTPTDGTALFYTDPWRGGESHFRDAVRYTNTASMGVINVAADRPQTFLYNMYRMGRDAIAAGQSGDPYAYVLPPEQWHPGEAYNLVNILRQGGVTVTRATTSFVADGKSYPTGTFVVPAAQAFRPFLMDLLEPQTYPTRRTATGAPKTPYDLAGWTLPMQMGVTVERIDEPFDTAMETVTDSVALDPGTIEGAGTYGYALSHRPNLSIKAVNDLLDKGQKVHWGRKRFSVDGVTFGRGGIVVERQSETRDHIRTVAAEYGLDVQGLSQRPDVPLRELERLRVGLYKSWVPSMDEGWTRWILKTYNVPVDTLHDTDVRSRDLSQYTTIILPHHSSTDVFLNGYEKGTMPEQFVGGLGEEGVQALETYVEAGGTVMAFDRASRFAIEQFELPVRDVTEDLSPSEFFVPGSLLRTSVNSQHPFGYGLPDTVAASFSHGRAFEVVEPDPGGEAGRKAPDGGDPPPIDVVARYADTDLLMSGWARGENEYLAGKPAMMRVRKGAGSVVLFGFRPQFRGQPRGTYKLIFNTLHAATSDDLLRRETVSADPHTSN